MTKTTSDKTETAKSAKSSQKAAKETPKVETPATEQETVATQAPEQKVEETVAPEAATESAPETDAKKEESGESDPLTLADVFAGLFEGVQLPEGVAFAPEGFVLDLETDEDTAECCGNFPTPDEVFDAGVAEGLLRANHPVFGIGIQKPAPAPAPAPLPIKVVDETTASFAHLVELEKLHRVGILTDEEYTAKKTDILRRIY